MIESVEVSKFKGLREVKLRNLSRINVLVGDNGSGKTCLLEAIFLAAGLGPELYLRTRAWRGSGEKLPLGLDRDQYEALWKELFYGLDQNELVTLGFTDSNQGERRLNVSYDVAQSTLMPLDLNVRTSYESGDIHPISFKWKIGTGEEVVIAVPNPSGGPLQLQQIKHAYPMVFFAPTTIFSSEENAKRFSFLSRRRRHEPIVEMMRSMFPMVEDLSVEIVAGFPGIYASIKGLEEKVSIGSLSAGLTKYMTILLGIAAMPKGVVLVDEIENGFFYKKYGDVWKGITSLAHQHEVQLFLSTHSIECVQAAFPIVSEHSSWFSLLRTERRGSECIVKQFSGKDFFAALEQRTEFR